MSKILRMSRLGDEPGLYNVWRTVFGDSDSVIDGFFSRLYAPGSAAVCEKDGRIVSAAYAVPIGKLLVPGRAPASCAVTYALGTLPEYRSMGIGKKVAILAAEKCESFGAAVICPAEPSLFDYYGKLGYSTFFRSETRTFEKGELCPCSGVLNAESPASYRVLRETLLADTPHIDFSEKLIEYEAYICSMSGGGLYSVNIGGVTCAVSAEMRRDGTLFFEELLCPRGLTLPIVSLLGRSLDAERVIAQFPSDGENSLPSAMLLGSETGSGWFGFAFG